MTDYDKPTGSAGTLRIRDNGTTVEYWILCSNPSTNVASQGWNGTINGANVSGSVALPAGFGSVMVGVWAVSTAQTVLFNMFASGTSGLGGPTNHSAAIPRGPAATVPAQPAAPTARDITTTGMTLDWVIPADGGSPINQMLLRRFPTADTSGPPYVDYGYSGSTTSAVITGLDRATPYWWIVYARNTIGYSPPSPALAQATFSGAYVSDGTDWRSAELTVSDGTAWRPAEVAVSNGAAWNPAG